MKLIILLFLLPFLTGCEPKGFPSKAEVIIQFVKENPTAKVIDASPGEGDSSHVYWTIRYRLQDEDMIRESSWGIRKVDDATWENFSKEP